MANKQVARLKSKLKKRFISEFLAVGDAERVEMAARLLEDWCVWQGYSDEESLALAKKFLALTYQQYLVKKWKAPRDRALEIKYLVSTVQEYISNFSDHDTMKLHPGCGN